MYTTRGCTPGVPTVYPYPQYPWLTQPEGRRVRVLTGTGTGQPWITRGLPVLIPSLHGPALAFVGRRWLLWVFVDLRWPSLAVFGCCGPSWACVGLRWPSLAA